MARTEWVTVTDGAGVQRTVRPADAREIEASKAASSAPETSAPQVETATIAIDDQSVAPKSATKATKAKPKK